MAESVPSSVAAQVGLGSSWDQRLSTGYKHKTPCANLEDAETTEPWSWQGIS